jgi:hypothetical protein
MIVDVYENADASAKGNGGLFRNRDPKVDKSFVIPCPKSYIKKLAYCCYVDRWRNNVERTQLKYIYYYFKRIVQERFLSLRVVYFCFDQVHWNCTQLLTFESLPDSFGIKQSIGSTWD